MTGATFMARANSREGSGDTDSNQQNRKEREQGSFLTATIMLWLSSKYYYYDHKLHSNLLLLITPYYIYDFFLILKGSIINILNRTCLIKLMSNNLKSHIQLYAKFS